MNKMKQKTEFSNNFLPYFESAYKEKIWKIVKVLLVAHYTKNPPWNSMHIDVVKKIISYLRSDLIKKKKEKNRRY